MQSCIAKNLMTTLHDKMVMIYDHGGDDDDDDDDGDDDDDDDDE